VRTQVVGKVAAVPLLYLLRVVKATMLLLAAAARFPMVKAAEVTAMVPAALSLRMMPAAIVAEVRAATAVGAVNPPVQVMVTTAPAVLVAVTVPKAKVAMLDACVVVIVPPFAPVLVQEEVSVELVVKPIAAKETARELAVLVVSVLYVAVILT